MELSGGKERPKLRFDSVILIIAVLGIVTSSIGVLYDKNFAGRRTGWATVARTVQTDALDLTRAVEDVSRGVVPDFRQLHAHYQHLKNVMAAMRQGDESRDVVPMPSSVGSQLREVENAWQPLKDAVDQVLIAEADIAKAQRATQSLEAVASQVTTIYDGLASKLIEGGGASSKAVTANAQMARTQELRILGRRLLGDGSNAAQIARKIGSAGSSLLEDHRTLESDGPVGAEVRLKRPLVSEMSEITTEIAQLGPALGLMQDASTQVPQYGTNLIAAARKLESALGAGPATGGIQRNLVLPGLAVTVVALLLYLFVNVIAVRRRIRLAEESDKAQQAAIVSLLDEIATLADGDLTVRANVTTDFTGAIADSINYTVDTLRSLVGTINETAVEISAAASSTETTATLMKDGSEQQATSVVHIASRMKHSSEALNTIASRAEALSHQASNSVSVAHNGASTVGRSIQGMAALREQIQDTSKRIKRLGESSQEIGNIIEFINDIAEQTNTLALNASIQATMAGESGRGFAVVADEIQRLAERSAAAARQIETLVNTIQADTKEAIVSMELSTTNVISGARSAEEAGQSLTRIEATSTELASTIQEISAEAKSEAELASNIAAQVEGIRDSAIQTAESAQNTATAVVELKALSTKLRESVAGFTLPADIELGNPEAKHD